jgi:hypothetical protein
VDVDVDVGQRAAGRSSKGRVISDPLSIMIEHAVLTVTSETESEAGLALMSIVIRVGWVATGAPVHVCAFRCFATGVT